MFHACQPAHRLAPKYRGRGTAAARNAASNLVARLVYSGADLSVRGLFFTPVGRGGDGSSRDQ